MKIVHLNEFGSILGGAEAYIFGLSKILSESGHENILICGAEINNLECDFSGKKYIIPELANRHKDFDISKVVNVIREEDPDILYFHHFFHPKLINELTSIFPSCAYLHGVGLTCPGRRRFLETRRQECRYPLSAMCQLRAYREKCMPRNPFKGVETLLNTFKLKESYNKMGKLISPSNYLTELFIQNGVNRKKIEKISYFTFLPDIAGEKAAGSGRILFVGRIDVSKGVMQFIEAIKLMDSSTQATIVGTGPDLDKAKKFAEEKGVEVEFAGYMNYENLSGYYRETAAFVFPSIYPESFGIVGTEAGAFGCPTVGFDVGGVSEWLKDGQNGFLIKPYDVSDMAAKLDVLLKNREKLHSMGQAGRNLVAERFSPQVHVERLLSVFNDVLKERQT